MAKKTRGEVVEFTKERERVLMDKEIFIETEKDRLEKLKDGVLFYAKRANQFYTEKGMKAPINIDQL